MDINVLTDQNVAVMSVISLILSVIFAFSMISSYIIKKRITYASMFGRVEHKSGRLLGWLIAITFIIEFLNLNYTLYGIITCFICWLVYLVSHTLEKLIYGNHGFR